MISSHILSNLLAVVIFTFAAINAPQLSHGQGDAPPESNGNPRDVAAEPDRLLASHSIANRLLAFDGETHGGGFKYGDGKTPNYFVEGFSEPTDSIGWKTRLNEPATFEVAVKFRTIAAQKGGTYQIHFGDQTLDGEITTVGALNEIQSANLGRVTLPAGETEIKIHSTHTPGGDLIELFEIILTPEAK
jgi:hypothetical protein